MSVQPLQQSQVRRARRTGPRSKKGGKWLIYLVLILGALVTITPFLWLVRSSLMEPSQIFTNPPALIPKPFAWGNYSEAMTTQPFGRFFLNTLLIELIVVPGVVISSALAAYSFSRLEWRGRDAVFAVLLTGMMLPFAASLIPTFVLWQKLDAINTFAPLTIPAWFGGGAFNIFLLRQFFLTIPREIDESAYLDGATPLQILWRIILPLSKPSLTVVALFTFIAVWNDFIGPLIYLNDDSKFTLALGLASFKGLYTAQWGLLMAASVVVIIPIVVLYFLGQRYFVQGIATTGGKN